MFIKISQVHKRNVNLISEAAEISLGFYCAKKAREREKPRTIPILLTV